MSIAGPGDTTKKTDHRSGRGTEAGASFSDLNVAAANEFRRLLGKHAGTLEDLRHFKIAVVYTANKVDFAGIIRDTTQTRPYKSYTATAQHIADTLRSLLFDQVVAVSDLLLMKQILNGTYVPDLVWLNTGGIQGRDPMAHAAAFMESLGIPYIGSSPGAYANADDKTRADMITSSRGVRVPRSFTVRHDERLSDVKLENFLSSMLSLGHQKVVIKPINGRGSVGVQVLVIAAIRQQFIEDQQAKYGGIKIDEYLPGDEVTVSIVGTSGKPIVFPPALRQIHTSGIFLSLDDVEVVPRISMLSTDYDQRDSIIDLATKAYTTLRLSALARIDLRADAGHKFHVIDINPKPDLGTPTKPSITAIQAAAAGFQFHELIKFLVLCRIDQGLPVSAVEQELLSRSGHYQP